MKDGTRALCACKVELPTGGVVASVDHHLGTMRQHNALGDAKVSFTTNPPTPLGYFRVIADGACYPTSWQNPHCHCGNHGYPFSLWSHISAS